MNEPLRYPIKEFGYDKSGTHKTLTEQRWMIVTFLTRPEPEENLVRFYNLVSPGGFWKPIRHLINTDKKTILGWNFLTNWLSGIALIYGMTFGIGKIIFGDFIVGSILLFIAGAGFTIIYIGLRKGFD